MSTDTKHLHIVSDATGETAQTLLRACMAQFEALPPHLLHHHGQVKTSRLLEETIERIKAQPGLVILSTSNLEYRKRLKEQCERHKFPFVSILDSLSEQLAGFFEAPLATTPTHHTLDETYFKRIEALDFTTSHDDGRHSETLDQADIVLVGVSRTSKTPTSFYLSYRYALKVANVPLIQERGFDISLEQRLEQDLPHVFGLIADGDHLARTRRARLHALGEHNLNYANPHDIETEIKSAQRLFARHRIPMVNTTNRSIEEVAAHIHKLYEDSQRRQRESPG